MSSSTQLHETSTQPSLGSVHKTTSSVKHRFNTPNFGSRILTDGQNVFSHNAWDHVPPPNDQEERILQALSRQRNAPVSGADKVKYNANPVRHWDIFYKNNEDNFFRDRNWLHLEFPEIIAATNVNAGPVTIFEVGCGAGNTIFPLLSSNQNPNLSIIACDFSPRAVKLVQSHPLYSSLPTGRISAAIWDLTSTRLPPNVAPCSVDFILMIFVLSALHPNEWRQSIANLHTVLKPGGRIFLRDYGRYDLAQLRFKEGRLLENNFYIRGDKTRDTLDELANIFTGSPVSELMHVTTTATTLDEVSSSNATSGATTPSIKSNNTQLTSIKPADDPVQSSPSPLLAKESEDPPCSTSLPREDITHPSPDCHSLVHPLFAIEQLGVDNRLLVNRKRQLKMHRVWVQGKFDKIPREQ